MMIIFIVSQFSVFTCNTLIRKHVCIEDICHIDFMITKWDVAGERFAKS